MTDESKKPTAEELVEAVKNHAKGLSGKRVRTLRPVLNAAGQPAVDAEGNLLRRWGVPLLWLDGVTGTCQGTDVDYLLHRNGLFLAIEFKAEHEGEDGDGELQWAQWRTLADLAQTGLAVCYGVKYREAGCADKPPVIVSVCRITDEAAPFPPKWTRCNLGGLLKRVNDWYRNANAKEFVRRQRAAATFTQFMQLKRWRFGSLSFGQANNPERRRQRAFEFEAMRLAARGVREGRVPAEWADFEVAFNMVLERLVAAASDERSTA